MRFRAASPFHSLSLLRVRSLSLACLLWLLSCCRCCFCCCCIFAWPTSTAGQQRVPAEQQLFGQAEELNERMRNAKCVGDDSFSWVIASARLCDACRLLVFLLLLLRVCECVCVHVLLLSLNLLTVAAAAAAAVALYLPLLFVCLFICLLLLLNFVIIIIVGFLGKTRTHIVSEHDANDTFPQKHKQKQRQKQLQ